MNAFSAPVSVGTSKEAGLTDFLAKNWRGGYMAKLRAGRFLREKPVGASIAAAGAALTPLAPIGIPVAALGVALSPALRAHARSLAGGTARGLRAAAPVAGQAASQAASGARGAYGKFRTWMTPPPPPPPPSFLERLVSGARGTTGRLTNALQPRVHNRYKQSSASALSPPSVGWADQAGAFHKVAASSILKSLAASGNKAVGFATQPARQALKHMGAAYNNAGRAVWDASQTAGRAVLDASQTAGRAVRDASQTAGSRLKAQWVPKAQQTRPRTAWGDQVAASKAPTSKAPTLRENWPTPTQLTPPVTSPTPKVQAAWQREVADIARARALAAKPPVVTVPTSPTVLPPQAAGISDPLASANEAFYRQSSIKPWAPPVSSGAKAAPPAAPTLPAPTPRAAAAPKAAPAAPAAPEAAAEAAAAVPAAVPAEGSVGGWQRLKDSIMGGHYGRQARAARGESPWLPGLRSGGASRATGGKASVYDAEYRALRESGIPEAQARRSARAKAEAAEATLKANPMDASVKAQLITGGGEATTLSGAAANTSQGQINAAGKKLKLQLEASTPVQEALRLSSIDKLDDLYKLERTAQGRSNTSLGRTDAAIGAAQNDLKQIQAAIQAELRAANSPAGAVLNKLKQPGNLRRTGDASAADARLTTAAKTDARQAESAGLALQRELVISGNAGGDVLGKQITEMVGELGATPAARTELLGALRETLGRNPSLTGASSGARTAAKNLKAAGKDSEALALEGAAARRGWNTTPELGAVEIRELAISSRGATSGEGKLVDDLVQRARNTDQGLDRAFTLEADAAKALKAAEAARAAIPKRAVRKQTKGKADTKADTRANTANIENTRAITEANAKVNKAQATLDQSKAELHSRVKTLSETPEFAAKVNQSRNELNASKLHDQQAAQAAKSGPKTTPQNETSVIALQAKQTKLTEQHKALDALSAGGEVSALSTSEQALLKELGVLEANVAEGTKLTAEHITQAKAAVETAEASLSATGANALTPPVAGRFDLSNPLHAAGAAGGVGLGVGLLED